MKNIERITLNTERPIGTGGGATPTLCGGRREPGTTIIGISRSKGNGSGTYNYLRFIDDARAHY